MLAIAFAGWILILNCTAGNGCGDSGFWPSSVRETFRLNLIEDTAGGWRRRFQILSRQMQKQTNPPFKGLKSARHYYQNNWEPVVGCPYEARIGRFGDGGKWVCNLEDIRRPALVYSLGSNNQFHFEADLYAAMNGEVEIHTFDMGNFSRGAPSFVHYHQWGVGSQDFTDDKGREMVTLSTIMKGLGHTGKTIDILKTDIEGAEMKFS